MSTLQCRFQAQGIVPSIVKAGVFHLAESNDEYTLVLYTVEIEKHYQHDDSIELRLTIYPRKGFNCILGCSEIVETEDEVLEILDYMLSVVGTILPIDIPTNIEYDWKEVGDCY
jgi:hypothetical protein